MTDPDEMFSPAGLAYFLQSGSIDGYKGGERPPTVTVTIAGRDIPIDHYALNCDRCGGVLEPPLKKPARWLAYNKVLNRGGTVCLDCMAKPDTDDVLASIRDAGDDDQSVRAD